MSSNSAEKNAACPATARPRPQWSLTLWLTLFNAGAAFFILTLISALLYGGLAHQLRNQNYRYLHDELNLIEDTVRTGGTAALISQLGSEHPGRDYVKHYIRLLDRNERVVLETPGMEVEIPVHALPHPVRDGRPGVDRTWRTPDGSLILSAMTWVDLRRSSGEQGILQVALDVTDVDSILVSYRHKIYLCLTLGGVLCLVVSLLVSRRGTRPLREMADRVQGITVSNLEARIAGANWPQELNLLADAMNLMLGRLQDSFVRLHTSAANFTHKMRTPLTILRGEAEIALSRDRSVEELRDVIISSLEEHNRLSRLTDNIQFLNFADTGALGLSRQEVDAMVEIEKVIDYYSPIAEEKGVAISCRGNAVLNVDAPLFRKAVASLLSNAFTYNSAGGTAVIEVRQGSGSSGVLSVSDSGCGIAADEMSKIFDRFYRVYATRYSDPHGTGLGLPIVKTIMDLHKGNIEIESRTGEGTTVTLTFPAPAG